MKAKKTPLCRPRPRKISLPECDLCRKPQSELGALRFGPPRKIEGLPGLWCRKLHVCVDCEKLDGATLS